MKIQPTAGGHVGVLRGRCSVECAPHLPIAAAAGGGVPDGEGVGVSFIVVVQARETSAAGEEIDIVHGWGVSTVLVHGICSSSVYKFFPRDAEWICGVHFDVHVGALRSPHNGTGGGGKAIFILSAVEEVRVTGGEGGRAVVHLSDGDAGGSEVSGHLPAAVVGGVTLVKRDAPYLPAVLSHEGTQHIPVTPILCVAPHALPFTEKGALLAPLIFLLPVVARRRRHVFTIRTQ